ncbi:MAG: hypothetical protein IK149_05145 [Oscillospiraceae bacterium]|nr:hypothetical protein [Oscillospiraceae bacterium]
MKSDIIRIDNQGVGFDEALEQTEKVAAFRGLSHKETLQLTLCTEEMLSMARIVTGELTASFWLESEGKTFELHLNTKTTMDKDKRYQLLSAATSRKNEAANSFLGKLRDKFEEAMTAEADHVYYELPAEIAADIPNYHPDDTEWDHYERSVLRRVADDVKIAIRGGVVDMTVVKSFA